MNANGRRQRQAKNKFSHLAPRQRPNYRIRDLSASVAHEQRLRQRENDRRQRSKK